MKNPFGGLDLLIVFNACNFLLMIRSSRLNMEVATIPGMNPPAPDPVAAAAAAGGAGPSGGGEAAAGTPDYAALLQYLQYYQKQMGGEDGVK